MTRPYIRAGIIGPGSGTSPSAGGFEVSSPSGLSVSSIACIFSMCLARSSELSASTPQMLQCTMSDLLTLDTGVRERSPTYNNAQPTGYTRWRLIERSAFDLSDSQGTALQGSPAN